MHACVPNLFVLGPSYKNSVYAVLEASVSVPITAWSIDANCQFP